MRVLIQLAQIIVMLGWVFGAVVASAIERVEIEVKETAGIRRFGYPVEVPLYLDGAIAKDVPFRLSSSSGPIAAQLTPVADAEDENKWWLDFSISLLPFESQTLILEYGEGVHSLAARGGLALENLPGDFRIHSGNILHWQIPKDLRGLVSSLTHSGNEQLVPEGRGLYITLADKRDISIHSLLDANSHGRWQVQRSGANAVQLHRQDVLQLENGRALESDLELQFVNTKSWIRCDWRLRRTASAIMGLGFELTMALAQAGAVGSERNPTLVDFGATSWTYAQLAKSEEAIFLGFPRNASTATESDRSWEIRHGKVGNAQPFVLGPPRTDESWPEGWAHVMDSHKCLALAVDQFAKTHRDSISVRGDGVTKLDRRLLDPQSTDSVQIRFWLHFVTNPPHISAATSPQAMLAPLSVRVLPKSGR